MIDCVVDDEGNPIIVAGVTTVLKAFGAGPGLVQFAVDQTAAFAVANVDSLLNRSQGQGWGFLRWYHKREVDLEDPLRNASKGVVNDLAQLGTSMHDYIEADIWGDFPAPITTREQGEMVEAWESWRFEHEIKPMYTEVTVYGDGYAGTLDGIGWIDGKLILWDVKTSRRVGDSHLMQLAALREAKTMLALNSEGEWEVVELPEYEAFGFIQVRPNDTDTQGVAIPAFVQYHEYSEEELDLHYVKFQACLTMIQQDQAIKRLRKSKENQ